MIYMSQYQAQAKTTAVFPPETALAYLTLGLVGEAGEIANKAKKVIRDGKDPSELAAEIGDVLWYTAMLADHLGVDLGDIADANLKKLAARASSGTLKGDGDNR